MLPKIEHANKCFALLEVPDVSISAEEASDVVNRRGPDMAAFLSID